MSHYVLTIKYINILYSHISISAVKFWSVDLLPVLFDMCLEKSSHSTIENQRSRAGVVMHLTPYPVNAK